MKAGFEDKLHCEGIVGDGCGGGRIFFVDAQTLYAYDPITKEDIKLLVGVVDAQSISKKACIVSVKCKDEDIEFDLSLMKRV
jgi:hypothetical protein